MSETGGPMTDFVSHLLSLGLGRTALTETLRLAELAFGKNAISGASVLERRERERLKKERQRAKKRGFVPGDAAGTAVNAISSSESKVRKPLKKEDSAHKAVPGDKGDKPKRSGTRISEDWVPSDDDVAYGAKKLGLTREQVFSLGEDMRLWAVANANRAVARKDNWTLTFYGWMRREAPKLKRFNQGGTNAQAQSADDVRKSGFSGLAARMRHGSPEPERPAPEDLEPVNRR